MATNKIQEKKEATEKVKEGGIAPSSACNEFKITGHYRNFVLHKYKNKEFTKLEWKEKLKKDGLEIK